MLTVTAEHQSIANGSAEANGYRTKMMKFEFILCLFLLESVLMKTHCLSVQLQGEGIDAVYAADLIQTVEEALLGCRSEQEYCQMQKQASDFAQKVGVDCAVPSNDESTLQTKRVRETSKKLIDYLVQSTTGERPSNIPATFKETVYFPCLDKIIDEFRRRFSDNAALLSSLVCFDPKNEKFLSSSLVEQFLSKNIHRFPQGMDNNIEAEVSSAKPLASKAECKDIFELYEVLNKCPNFSLACSFS